MIYLDNASTSYPKPEAVYKAMDTWMREFNGNSSRGSHKLAMKTSDKIYQVRESVSKLFNIKEATSVVFTSNTTDSLNIALKGLLVSGDHVITTSMEHNSMVRPIMALQKVGVEHDVVKCDNQGRLNPDSLLEYIRPNTKLIALTHGSNVVGTIMDIIKIGALAKKNNIHLLVDAAQTAGVYPIDVQKMNIDLLAVPGHKNLLGPQGTGILYVSENIKLTSIKEGGTGSKSELLTQPEIMPDLLESGTLNTPGIVGLGAGIDFVLTKGVETIKEREQSLVRHFLHGLRNINGIKIYGVNEFYNENSAYEEQLGVVSINIKNEPASNISYALDTVFNIATRAGLHCAPFAHKTLGTLDRGTVRFGLGYFNTKEDIDTTLEAIRRISREV